MFTRMTDLPHDQVVNLKSFKAEDNIWIDAGARVIGGIVLGGVAVVTSGAETAHDIFAISVVDGVPARVPRHSKLRPIASLRKVASIN